MIIDYLENGIKIDGEFVDLALIISNCNNVKVKSNDLVMLKFKWVRRNEDIYEDRVYPKKIAKRLVELLTDKEIYFGEIEGKHSEVYGTLERDEMMIDVNKSKIKDFLINNPDGWDYNHSFLNAHSERIQDNPDEDDNPEEIKEFLNIYNYKIN